MSAFDDEVDAIKAQWAEEDQRERENFAISEQFQASIGRQDLWFSGFVVVLIALALCRDLALL